jgi:hypothetical protein
MLTGSCHCGAVQIQVARKPRRLTSCNCSICRRHAGLWGYYNPSKVKITVVKVASTATRGVTSTFGCVGAQHVDALRTGSRPRGAGIGWELISVTSILRLSKRRGFEDSMVPRLGSSWTERRSVAAVARVRPTQSKGRVTSN